MAMIEQNNTTTKNKALWIFPNFKEAVDSLPEELRGRAWELIINFGFGIEPDLEKEDPFIKIVFLSLKPLLRLRGVAGVPKGVCNNKNGYNQYNNKDNINLNNEDNNQVNNEDNINQKEQEESENSLSVDYGDKILIGENFKINFEDKFFNPYRLASKKLSESVEWWLIKNKLGKTVAKKFIQKQITNFAKRQGCLESLIS